MQQAATSQVNATSHQELAQHVETAADNAQQNGNQQVASELRALLQQYSSDPQGFKTQSIAAITSDPQILQQFAPEFAQRVLSSL